MRHPWGLSRGAVDGTNHDRRQSADAQGPELAGIERLQRRVHLMQSTCQPRESAARQTAEPRKPLPPTTRRRTGELITRDRRQEERRVESRRDGCSLRRERSECGWRRQIAKRRRNVGNVDRPRRGRVIRSPRTPFTRTPQILF